MRISIILNNGIRVPAKRFDNADFVTIRRCPNQDCRTEPCRVRGDGSVSHDHGYGADCNTYRVRAIALCCTDEDQIVDIGVMEVQVETVFGIDEDIAATMRVRVYGGGS
ncbi:MAG TPA: hypothetical protein VNR64_06770 [Vicinamibacterales bacterium]|nr:hypothetical protein [Vicinamibacterales bacterium]